ncbi:MAG: nucleotidyltransferase family protein [Betaproteobacteria bacterium]|nr:nucleotidyltransferase family protein [Betaproteobacteria bacterium]
MEAIILAGGLGTRLRSVVRDVPKPMAAVNGRPFLEHLMRYWTTRGVRRFVLSVGYLSEVIVDYFGERFEGVPLSYALEEQPLGTGGGLLCALPRIEGACCLALNGDTFFDVDPAQLEALHRRRGVAAAMALFEAPPQGRYMGVLLGEDGRVSKLSVPIDQGAKFCNGGVYWLRKDAFEGSGFEAGGKCSLEADLFEWALAHGAGIAGLPHTGLFIDIGVPEDLLRAGTILAGRNPH